MTTQRIAELLKEMPLINDAYDHIRAEQVFAIDDIEYDMFSTGWKSAVDLATDNLTSHLAELQSTIAALEAEVIRLRNALKHIKYETDIHGNNLNRDIKDEAVKALSTPFTPTVLPELIEKVERLTIERCAAVCDVEWNGDSDTYEYSIAANDLAAAIRELGEQ